MKLVNSSFEIIEQGLCEPNIWQHIEKCARVSYKSEDKITDDSYQKFCSMLIKRGHLACLEHGTVYLFVPYDKLFDKQGDNWVLRRYGLNPYSFVHIEDNGYYVTTNMRVIHEHDWYQDVNDYYCKHDFNNRITVKFTIPIHISREFLRHRVFSFMEQSTRYCNFSHDKFGGEIECILPDGFKAPEGHIEEYEEKPIWMFDDEWEHHKSLKITSILRSYIFAEKQYMNLINQGVTPQIARAVLPLATKTELVMTGTIDQWWDFFNLRCASDAHPQAREVAIPLREEFIKRGYDKH